MIKPRMLGHLVIRVRDAQRSEDFYTKILGLEVRNRTRGGKMRFFTSNPEIDHELAVAEIGDEAVGPISEHIGLYHMAWELADMDELKDAYQVVLDNDVDVAGFGDHVADNVIAPNGIGDADGAGFGDHGATKGLYIRDPDGIEIELYAYAPDFEKTPLQEILKGGSLQGTTAD